ncbi:MAG: hypothetical protein DVB25_04940 [Verrucomicrobia bacterium]|nr:MAG: hypothetical protein DVB25_04940 [Verrucomicrobiota bacterium]
MSNQDELAQMLSAASGFRAAELVNGKNFTREQISLYIKNYTGKYSQKIVEAGVGLVILDRLAKVSFAQKIKNLFYAEKNEMKKQLEVLAAQIASNPDYREAVKKLIDNDFRRQ